MPLGCCGSGLSKESGRVLSRSTIRGEIVRSAKENDAARGEGPPRFRCVGDKIGMDEACNLKALNDGTDI